MPDILLLKEDLSLVTGLFTWRCAMQGFRKRDPQRGQVLGYGFLHMVTWKEWFQKKVVLEGGWSLVMGSCTW